MIGRWAGCPVGRVDFGVMLGVVVRVRQRAHFGGGPQARVNSRSHPCCQGQLVGRCRVRVLAVLETRVGTLIRVRRIVAVVALVEVPCAMVATARVRLKAMHANTNHAALAVNRPEVIWSQSGGVHDVHDIA